ncbi:hypothetical protein [Methylobacterium nodulans]|uniref:hypothetical protein n=1 Tax=Methylobacterium nodulans TaxID=114616 RepID=UPI000161868A|nr:hypothetical protein [Methylobacterium nodulans]
MPRHAVEEHVAVLALWRDAGIGDGAGEHVLYAIAVEDPVKESGEILRARGVGERAQLDEG